MEKNKETIEEASEKYSISCGFHKTDSENPMRISFKIGAKWQQERSYTEEEVLNLLKSYQNNFPLHRGIQVLESEFNNWFKQFKK